MSTKNLTANRGEWSELYVFFKLLSDGELYAADGDLNKINNIYYPIVKIIRDEIDGKWDYYRNSKIKIINAQTKEIVQEIPISDFELNAKNLLNTLKDKKNKGSFSLPSIENFMKAIKCNSIKLRPTEKRDITIVVHDLRTGKKPTLGFSIKSQRNLVRDIIKYKAWKKGLDPFKYRNDEGIRKMTEREWARLQGFPEDFKFPVSMTQAYRQLANSVPVPVIKAIALEIKKSLENKIDLKSKLEKYAVVDN
ncbi:MAG: HpaII family restriction endonuclease [Candidatus Lokiarchaeota archaeon]|nr:HpaII family restriction endonuclease [Candidatus Lokiarchaeota archaeon]